MSHPFFFLNFLSKVFFSNVAKRTLRKEMGSEEMGREGKKVEDGVKLLLNWKYLWFFAKGSIVDEVFVNFSQRLY